MKPQIMRYITAFMLVLVLLPGFALAQRSDVRDQDLFKNIQKEGVMKVGTQTTPPKLFQNEKGEWVGVFRDFFQDFADELGVKLEMIGSTPEYLIAGLESGRWDFAPCMNVTVKRAMVVKFAPTHNPELDFMYMKNNKKIPHKEFYSLAELDKPGLTVAVMTGSSQHQIIKSKVKNLKIFPVPSTTDTWMAVQGGRADFAVGWTPEMAQFVAKNQNTSAIGSFKPTVAKTLSGIAVRGTVSELDLQVLNTMIINAKFDGRFEAWYRKYSEFPKGYNLDSLLWPR